MTVLLQVAAGGVAVVVLLGGLGCLVGGWLRRVQPPPFDRCDDPECPYNEEVGS